MSSFISLRSTSTRGGAFCPEQCVSREEVLQVPSLSAAFEENLKGSLEAGKLANLVVLSQDILTVPADKLRKTKVDLTIVDGKVLYERR